MVSYAAPGGGVGPHFDSYDVFLLQGFGRRRWRYGRQDDLSLREGLPLKILRRFTPSHDDVLAPGDMLYLPPSYAHDGVALDACTTYSIGFRAATHTELAQAFLDHLRDRVDLPGRYADPDLRPAREPARIDAAMQRRAGARARDDPLVAAATSRASSASSCPSPRHDVFFDAAARAAVAARVRGGRAPQGRAPRPPRAVAVRRRRAVRQRRSACVAARRAPRVRDARQHARTLAGAGQAASTSDAIAVLHDDYRHGSLHLG